ncbi:MAG: type II toxin-antitoxin system death-on-curing family toxin [Euryarchaeota archaeon]|nr:type II toxin-antitoxin system death-on-curing family toxin [Euryarchaeota archaeon]
MPTSLFSEKLWKNVNEHFRTNGQLYVDAPRPRTYEKKAQLMWKHFPNDLSVEHQAAYLVKNLVNLQRYADANKRTASVLLEVFLETNGYQLTCTNEEYAEFLLKVQRMVPAEMWDGRSFTLKPEYIPWHEDKYHWFLHWWMDANAKKKK